MTRYAAALSQHPLAYHAVGETAGEILERFDGDAPDLVVCFASPHHTGAFEDVAAGLRDLLEPDVFVGGTVAAVAGGPREVEDGPGLAVFAADVGRGRVRPVALEATPTPDGTTITGWPETVAPAGTLLLLADPYSFPAGDLLGLVNGHLPGLAVVGGLASAAAGPGGNRLALDGRVTSAGAVGALLDPGVPVHPVVSQGCRPVGRPLTVTRAERNLLLELAGRPAVARLQELAASADEGESALLARGLHVGLVVDEHRADFGRGDFLVRNVIGADERTGALAVGEVVEVGTTVQFQVRDADAADDDLRAALNHESARAALLFTCNGRGSRLFGRPDHDAGVVEELLGPVPLAGAFCAGEIGPVAGRNHLHGFTACLALFG